MSPKRLIKIALGFNPFALKHLLKGEPRKFLVGCERAFRACRSAPAVEPELVVVGIPEQWIDELLADAETHLSLRLTPNEDGALPLSHAVALLTLLKREAPAAVLEIGTFMGHTTRRMAENLPTAIIHTVDLPREFAPATDAGGTLPKDDFHLIGRREVGREFKGAECASRIVQHFADTARWDFSEASPATAFFIDGSHTYEYCASDSEHCLKLCGGRGLFIWHDCDESHPGVVRFLEEWRAAGRDIRRIAGTSVAYWRAGGTN